MPSASTAPPRNWLILAHCFNMDGRAASQTITDRIPGLLAAGIRPIVVSAPTGLQDRRFPHHRVYSPSPSCLLFELRHVISREISSRALQKLLKALLTLLLLPLYLPEKIFIHLDSQWSWFLSATWRGWWLVRKYRPEVVYSTAGPPSTHLAGLLVAKLCRLPWVAEVHDPLVYDWQKKRWQNEWFKAWLEKRISRDAAAVIYFTDTALAKAKGRHDFAGKTFVLRPGAAPPELGHATYQRSAKIHFGHFGSLGNERNLAQVFQALHELLAEQPAWQDLLALDVYGTTLDPVSAAALERYPLPGVIQLHGRLERDPASGKSGRERVLEAMRRTDVLLLLHGSDAMAAEYIPSKLYEYLLMQRPILAIVGQNSELQTILSGLGHPGVTNDSLAPLKGALAEFIQRWQEDGLPDTTTPSPFTVAATVTALLRIVAELDHR